MTGIQKTVAEGLRYLAQKVQDGAYGQSDSAFVDEDKDAFLEDLQDEVIGKIESDGR